MHQKRLILFFDMSISHHLASGVVRYFKNHTDWTLHVEPGFSTTRLPEMNLQDNLSGISGILVQTQYSPVLEKYLQNLKLPVIAAIDKKVANCINVIADEELISQNAYETLSQIGFSNFAFYGYSNKIFSINRRKTFVKKLKAAGITPHTYQDDYYDHMVTWSWDAEKLSDWLKSLPKPVGIMCCCDHTAFRLVNTCKELGIDIPERVAVLSVGDNRLICSLNNPEISSITMDFEQSGYLAAELLQKAAQKKTRKTELVLVPPKYVSKRHSTDILITPDSEVTKAIRYIHSSAGNLTSVADVVRITNNSRRHLERKFKEIFKRTIYQEIRRVKVEHIARMLLDTNLTVSEISYTLGYMGDSHIRRYFKAETGMTPTQYRNKSRK
ncbi:Xylose operon regulatory protein [Limihaloglobus sulfuriphilus]|uniref:Xylose operon regulatory protein n=1 Tax=Limihaloglobus sulfuriphilus TaxID=1851148 RepID=A0A1Q2MDG3_9BACT|nr:DNA-binding transcriptional regulator [Limihaloglobus sulfuriphilus]AQQ70357.1 Xylose operon regulatory protein [Limihaloglobus sulfuriphilus]